MSTATEALILTDLNARDAAEAWYQQARESRRTLTAIIDQARRGATRGELACAAARHLGWCPATVFALAEELADIPRPAFQIDASTYREIAVDPARITAPPEIATPAPASAFAAACERTRRLFEAEDTGLDIELTESSQCECCGETAGPGRRALGLTGCLTCWEDGSMTSGIEDDKR